MGSEIFRTSPGGSWGPHRPLCSGNRVFFPRVKRLGRGVDHPPPSNAKVNERVELYLCSSSGPSGPVLTWFLPTNVKKNYEFYTTANVGMTVSNNCLIENNIVYLSFCSVWSFAELLRKRPHQKHKNNLKRNGINKYVQFLGIHIVVRKKNMCNKWINQTFTDNGNSHSSSETLRSPEANRTTKIQNCRRTDPSVRHYLGTKGTR